MLRNLKKTLAFIKILNKEIAGIKTEPLEQGDLRDMQAVRRVREAFIQQEHSMSIHASIPHSCDDPILCNKEDCFQWKPDIIVDHNEKKD